MGQGNDRGTQYRSGIYCNNADQKELALHSKKAYEHALLEANAGMGKTITTEIVYPAPKFYYAEDYHQQYLAKPGARPYCSAQPQQVSCPHSKSWEGLSEQLQADHQEKLSEEFWTKHAPTPHCVIHSSDEQIQWPPTHF